ncbi:drug/metabolite transporter (DMT)-like permease [Ancylobacter sp. 3268]|uniref:DMT family transporter n=1 Tax=Ancylobacter sp. 3268 TaxID=2817752 RepID=UPI002864AC80|nr:EamA family transporter [Ancylobacter sp. 3268]MDR6953456.1 drug/metabolite transporter (DMT)-like permease [Ancylobacter sp. 3268]
MAPTAADRSGTPAIPLSAYAHLLTIYIVWGGAYLAVKICISGPAAITVPQLQSTRMWGAALLIGAVALARTRRVPHLTRRDIALCTATGLLMWVGGNGLATLASRHATSSFIVMAMGAIPLWSCLLELVIARTLPARRVVLGLVLGLAGLFLVVAPTLIGTGAAIIEPGYAGLTVVLLIGAGMSWSLGTIVQRPLMKRMRPEWAATLQLLTAALVLSVVAAGEHAPLPDMPSTRQWLAFGFLIVFASVIGLTSYIRVIGAFSPVIASTFAYVNPIIGVLLGWILLGEEIAPVSLLGLGIVLASIAIVLSGRR